MVPRKSAAGAAALDPTIQALQMGTPRGALSIPTTRRPTRGALGGRSPISARTKLPPSISATGQRGGAAKVTPKAKKATAKKRKATN